jgi:hypothetical protein
MPITPPRKQAIKTQAASLAEYPASCSDFLDEGNILYSAENSMTPKLRLSETDRNTSLSWMRKFLWPGNCRMSISIQMKLAPNMQAIR